MNTPASVKSATRVLDLLEMLASAADQVGVSEISRRLAIPKSSAHMLLATLESRGYVIGDADRRFHLNPILASEGRSWIGGSSVMLMRLAREPMAALARATGESSFLGVARDENHVEYIAKEISDHEVRCDAELGQPRPMHSTSVGLVVLAFQDAAHTERFLQRGKLERVTRNTVTDARELRRELAHIRERGYAVVSDTNSAGASGIAAPIFDGSNRVVAALNLSAPTARFEPMLKKSAHLLRAAQAMSRELAGA